MNLLLSTSHPPRRQAIEMRWCFPIFVELYKGSVACPLQISKCGSFSLPLSYRFGMQFWRERRGRNKLGCCGNIYIFIVKILTHGERTANFVCGMDNPAARLMRLRCCAAASSAHRQHPRCFDAEGQLTTSNTGFKRSKHFVCLTDITKKRRHDISSARQKGASNECYPQAMHSL